MYAIEQGDIEIVQRLINNDADIDVADNEGKSILMYLLEQGDKMSDMIYRVANRLDNRIGDVSIKDDDGRTLLMYACAAGCTYVVEKIVERLDLEEDYAYINAEYNGYTALGRAFKKGNKDLTKYLINKGIRG